jgi:Tfp pilus assembly protein PilO
MALDYKSSLSRYRRYLQLVQARPLWTASLWVILSLILLIALVVLALRPTLVTISGLLGQIKQQKEISRQLDEKIANVEKALTRLDEVSPKIPLLDKMLPVESDWSSLAANLEKIATESGLVMESVTIDKIPLVPGEQTAEMGQTESQLPAGVMPVKFIFAASGEYTQIREMLSDLENLRRVSILSSVEINTNKDGSLRLVINGEAGFIPDEFL